MPKENVACCQAMNGKIAAYMHNSDLLTPLNKLGRLYGLKGRCSLIGQE